MAIPESTTEDGLRLGLLDDGRPTSTAEADFEEPYTFERIHGRLVVMSPEGTGHVIQSVPWHTRLAAFALDHPEVVQAVVAQAWIHVDEDNTRIADIGVYLGGRLDDLEIPNQVSDLVLEFVSKVAANRRRDYVEKRAQYEKLGVREYVIVDRFDKKVTVLTLVEGVYQEQIFISTENYRSPLLPGFEVRLAEILP